MEEILTRLVQIGTVTAIDNESRKARVKFQDTGITSDWLCVLQHPSTSVTVESAGKHSHSLEITAKTNVEAEDDVKVSVDVTGTVGEESEHKHKAYTNYWMPRINDTVVVLYLPVFNSDGFILGEV